MKKSLLSFHCILMALIGLSAQVDQPNSFGKGSILWHQDRIELRGSGDFFKLEWAPFYHGVASGDPLEDRVVIWTRVTPESTDGSPLELNWVMATDPELANIVTEGTVSTGPERDYTVKVDVTGLSPGTTYYYGFNALGKSSLTGKTKTTPIAGNIDHFKFGVVSCSNYQAGYFNAYARLAERTDLDAIIHLGDYIYEYADQVYGSGAIWKDRPLEPVEEIISLEDYRSRYSIYRLDTNLVRLHQQYPFITVWDDHESANDSYADGAENHDPGTEGNWTDRKANAKSAYFEWMPIRDNAAQQVYRSIQYGELMELILLDTRLEGREAQINDITDPRLQDPERTILGADQKAWLLDRLANSTARWKIIGQQVIFAEFHVGWAGSLVNMTYESTESAFMDIWDGYPAERSEILSYLKDQSIDDVVILTGDFHTSFAFDLADPAVAVNLEEVADLGPQPFYEITPAYDPATGAGSRAVEFATPSITSANFDENSNFFIALALQSQINRPVAVANGTVELGNPNPHMKYADLVQHGYFILDVKPDSVQANWYYTPILQVDPQQQFGGAFYTRQGENHLRAAATASPPKAVQDVPAPLDPPAVPTPTRDPAGRDMLILSAFPNPARNYNQLQYALNTPTELTIELLAADGRRLKTLLAERMPAGIFSLYTDLSDLPPGNYFYRIKSHSTFRTYPLIKQ
ncbi:alkaline phosphatase D family protein [Flavilitoribacter nigricans]|uniref:Phosphodiesterase n=1 Tax=Flavilitoribacter nigricans (strain ATCC 23147 / DSM 23189 / NBRC 102662 / NCIMB 1420 / SS-2) TaxID=1122177 RepID=A0A2D0NA48_FLAN2|nr:alkaline phosphatase D family protein [Flavilitoribacter nigricans]PHN05258.1 phosphodiesterase [Flavilitoribacter nigricans DSM 23189 = NBRC 102662]